MKNSSKRAISRILALVMMVTCSFANIMITNAEISDAAADSTASGSAVENTESAIYTFDVADLTASADKEVLDQSEVDSYFTVIGTIQKRLSSGVVTSVELAKNDGGQISFTTTADSSDVAFVFSSTGSDNESSYALIDDSGAAYAEGTVKGASAGKTTITADALPAGTYTITSPDKGFNRGGRIYTITVVENGSVDVPDEDTTTTETTTEATTAAPSDSDLGTPEAGVVYTVDFAGLSNDGYAVGDKVGGKLFASDMVKIVSDADTAYYHDTGHGLALANGDKIQVAVAGNADVTLSLCQYGNGTAYTVTDADGNELGTVAAKGAACAEAATYTYTGAATVLTFTLASAGEAYLHGVTAKNAAEATGVAEDFELWLDDIAEDVDGTLTVEPGVYMFADSSLELVGNGDTKFTPEIAAGQNILRAGKIVNSYKAGARNATANDIATVPQQGDGTAIVFTPAATGMFNTYFYSTSFLRVWDFDANTGERYGYVDSDTAAENFAFTAEVGHTYVLSTTGKTNNCAFAGFEYIVDEIITVPVNTWTTDGKYNYDNVVATLTDVALGTTAGTIKLDTTSIKLYKNHTYSLSTNDGGAKATFAGEETYKVADDSAITLAMEEVPDVTLTGTFVGADPSVVRSVTFTSMVSGTEYTAELTEDGYTVILKPGEYNTTVDAEGYYTKDRASVVNGEENVDDIYLESLIKSKYVLPEEVAENNTALGLNGITANNSTSVKGVAGSTVVIPVNGEQIITVAGWYAGTWDINGQNSVTADSSSNATNPVTNTYVTDGTETSVTVNITGEGANYLYWITVEDVTHFDAANTTISVPGDFDTLKEAVAYIRDMADRPDGEDGRMTISLTADIQEQIVFDTPYITLQGNGHEISWYYGQSVKYYSVDTDGLYSERLFQDKYSKTEASGNLWGGVAIIRGDNFIAENTTFRNTFNYEVTEKELEDGAESVDLTLGLRNAGDNVAAYKYKERSNAFYIEADNIEAYNCEILSSQDTLGRNGSANNGYHTYFKDCVIGGNTDYICGEFAAVFDNCELLWKGFGTDTSNNGKVGYIVAPKTSPYVFRNCEITTDPADSGVMGYYGRTWGANSNAAFINTETNGTISTTGWGEMTSGDLATATFYEYNNTENGYEFATTTNGLALTDELIASYIDDDTSTAVDTVLAGWTPVHYEFIPFEASTETTETTTEATTESTTEGTTEGPVDPVDPASATKFIPTADILKDEVAYSDDNIEIVAAQDLTYGAVETSADKAIIEAAGKDYTNYLVSNSANTTLLTPGAEKASAYRLVFKITAKQDMTVSIDNKVGKNSKTNAILSNLEITGTTESGDPSGTATIVTSETNDDAKNDVFSTLSFTLKAGETVYFAGKGTNPNVYSVMYTVDGSTPVDPDDTTTTEATTEATTADNTTTEATTEATTAAPTPDTGKWGDVNDNGVVEANDAALVLQYVLNNATEMVVARADVSGDGVIDSEDAAMILQKALDSTYVFPVEGSSDEPEASDAVLYVVGDSTGCHYADTADANYYYKRVGFGDRIEDYANIQVENLALSGRSSKSFTSEANYETLKNNIKAGDILLIAFGHNDEKSEDATRYTAPGGTKDTEGSFKNSLYVNYVKLAQDAGATPILCSPIVRRSPDGSWSGNTLHVANDGNYANDVKELAAEVNVPFIDLTQITKAKYDELTPSNTLYLHAWTSSKDTSVDNTHLNNYGAKEVAYLIATNAPAELLPYVKDGIVEPTIADLIVNPNYVEPSDEDLKGDDLISVLWNTTSPWYGTVFGDIGGEGKLFALNEDGTPDYTKLAETNGVTNFAVTENADGSVNIRAGHLADDMVTGKLTYGKIAGSTDGIAMYYRPVDVAQNFSISGKAHVNGVYNTNNQTTFGAIVADSIQVDKYDAACISNYVAAAPLKMTSTVGTVSADTGSVITAWGGYARIDGTLTSDAKISTIDDIPQPGDEIDVKITKVGNEYTVQYGNYTSTFTVAMNDQAYVGFFVARCADVTFSDINFNNEVTE